MSSTLIQLLVLAGIAIFLIVKLRNVLGSREGFEKPPARLPGGGAAAGGRGRAGFEVIEGGPDADITDHVPEGSESAKALAAMKAVEPAFSVSEFMRGAGGAYEMIVMAFERGEIEPIRPFLSDEVHATFAEVVAERERQELKVEAKFVGLREVSLVEAEFDRDDREAEITVRFVGELTSAVYDSAGRVVEGHATEVRRQKDIWTFARVMGSNDPNWRLVATGD